MGRQVVCQAIPAPRYCRRVQLYIFMGWGPWSRTLWSSEVLLSWPNFFLNALFLTPACCVAFIYTHRHRYVHIIVDSWSLVNESYGSQCLSLQWSVVLPKLYRISTLSSHIATFSSQVFKDYERRRSWDYTTSSGSTVSWDSPQIYSKTSR